ncbi:MAG: hypothetical protein JST89_20635 [Cyanobacteria bacterium SZAS-4]|nr:hypothetical protein [Cyanobacteria bacterium SZAS-4]
MHVNTFLKYREKLFDDEGTSFHDQLNLAVRAYERLYSDRVFGFDGLSLEPAQRRLETWKEEISHELEYEDELVENWDKLDFEYGPGATEEVTIYLATPPEDRAWNKISTGNYLDLDALRPDIREQELERWRNEIVCLSLDKKGEDPPAHPLTKIESTIDHEQSLEANDTASMIAKNDVFERAYENLFGSRKFSFNGLSPETVARELKIWKSQTEVELDYDRWKLSRIFDNNDYKNAHCPEKDRLSDEQNHLEPETRAWNKLYLNRAFDLDELRPAVRKQELERLQDEVARLHRADRENSKPMAPEEYRKQAQSILSQFGQVTGAINLEIQHKEFDKVSHTLSHHLEVYKESHPAHPNTDLIDRLRRNFNTRDDVKIDSNDDLDEHEVDPPDDFLSILFAGESTVILLGTHDPHIEALYENWALQAFDPNLIKKQNDLAHPTPDIEERIQSDLVERFESQIQRNPVNDPLDFEIHENIELPSSPSQSREEAGEISKPFHSEHPENNRTRDDDDHHHSR